ncbi:hypothetical protein CEXT_593491 [Caerostris extrusa]|uniref:Uncharacterized protein n=1 Tax=Caerostris extrusa TaxID=172846 RepID=A0AAV4PGR2_CAEEX|nr:hypothetical protein CEXT_593491 [Caerostris extrusa]
MDVSTSPLRQTISLGGVTLYPDIHQDPFDIKKIPATPYPKKIRNSLRPRDATRRKYSLGDNVLLSFLVEHPSGR